MGEAGRRALAAVAVWMALGSSSAEAGASRVLFIGSYNATFPTFGDQREGLLETLGPSGHAVDIELMDSKRFPGAEARAAFEARLAEKLRAVGPYDAIIAGDDNATRFAVEAQARLFAGAPIVFFGLNDVELAERLDRRPGVTGVVEAVSLQDTLTLMSRLHPQVTRFLAVVDATTTGRADLARFEGLQGSVPGVAFDTLSLAELSLDELAVALGALGERDAVLLLSAFRDRTGARFRFEESLKRIVEATPRPVYHLWAHGVGDGLVGGKVVDHRQQSRAAAEMVLQILGGRSVDAIPVLQESPNRLLLDRDALARTGAALDRVPPEAVLLNVEVGFYEAYRNRIWAAGIAIVVLSILSTLLAINVATRHRIERQLRLREAQMRRAVLATPIELALLEGDRISLVNDRFKRSYGYDSETTPTLEDFWPRAWPDAKERRAASAKWQQTIEHARATGQPSTETEVSFLAADGTRRTALARVALMEGATLLMLEDITGEREAEERRITQQKLQSIGTLSAGVAHDFNNILTPILGYAELSTEDVAPGSDLADNLEQIRVAAVRAKGLVQRILTFSRRSTGERSIVQPRVVVREVLELLRASLPATVDIRQENASRGRLRVDVVELHQVVMNLCTNAARAMGRPGGELTVSTRDEPARARWGDGTEVGHSGDWVRISVSDTGPGIPSAVLPRIFDPFFTTGEPGESTGLGLAVVHGVVTAHGGHVEVDTEEGRGTTFHIWLPQTDAPADVEAESPRAVGAASISGAVLVVDDEAPIRRLLETALTKVGLRVTCAGDGQAGLEALGRDRFDLVITDALMPRMTGEAFVEALRETHPTLPVILCTGHAGDLSENWFAAQRLDAVLQKPIRTADLVATVRSVLGSGASEAATSSA